MEGFEPTASPTRTARASRTAPHPETFRIISHSWWLRQVLLLLGYVDFSVKLIRIVLNKMEA